ncbi:hypothetical protein Tsubulata_022744 [Turnera subulata]|uniref:Uncharacterized protein n=1 Tax=Turnera subulata TaxID=218843 RepID=A0A9Q0F5V1_9ROSI|nr:hypothetical protein Tsubulata_022744 [Turnera subulata]
MQEPNNEDTKGSGVKLFIFGDSYVDTGNWASFNELKGIFQAHAEEWPRNNITSVPPLYIQWKEKSVSEDELQYGMNFAYGGSGALPDAWENRTVALQTNAFKEVLGKKVFTEDDLKKSVAVLFLVGNDYTRYVFKLNGTEEVSISF